MVFDLCPIICHAIKKIPQIVFYGNLSKRFQLFVEQILNEIALNNLLFVY